MLDFAAVKTFKAIAFGKVSKNPELIKLGGDLTQVEEDHPFVLFLKETSTLTTAQPYETSLSLPQDCNTAQK